MSPYRTFLTQRFTASAPTGLVVLHRLLLILIALFALIWVQGAWAGPPTDQLRDGVERVVKVLTDPELRGDTNVNERNAAINKVADDIFDFGEGNIGRSGRRPNVKSSFASSPSCSSAHTSPRWTGTTPR